MARQVYFDPFGSRLQGMQQGVRDEMSLQDQTRRARASDWDYANMAPLRLSEAQRNNSLAEFAVPYQQRAYGIAERQQAANLFGTEQPQFERIGQATGNYAPAVANAFNYGQGTASYLQSPQYFAPQVAAYGAQFREGLNPAQDEYERVLAGMAQQYGVDPRAFINTMRVNPFMVTPQVEQGYDQYLGFDRARQMAADSMALQNADWQRQYQQAALQNQADQQAQSRAWYGLQSGYATGRFGGGVNYGQNYTGYTGADDGLDGF